MRRASMLLLVALCLGSPLRAQDFAQVGEVFGSLVSPTSIEAGVPEASAPPARPRQRAAQVIRDSSAAGQLPQGQVTELNTIATELETGQTDVGKAAARLYTTAASVRSAQPDVADQLNALAQEVEDTREPGWYLSVDVPAGSKQVSLTRVKTGTPAAIETETLIGLVAGEPLYRVEAVSVSGDRADLTLSPATRQAYVASNEAKVDIRPERVGWLATPALRDAEDRLVTSLGLGAGYRGFEVTASFANTDRSGGGKDVESRTGKLKVPLRGRLHSNYNNQAALSLDTTDVLDVRQRHRAILSGNIGLDKGFCHFKCKTNIVANLGWAWDEPEAGERVDDLIGVVGLSHLFRPTVLLAADYSIENDLDLQNTFSLAVTKIFPDSRMTFGAAKHGTFFASYVIQF